MRFIYAHQPSRSMSPIASLRKLAPSGAFRPRLAPFGAGIKKIQHVERGNPESSRKYIVFRSAWAKISAPVHDNSAITPSLTGAVNQVKRVAPSFETFELEAARTNFR